MSVNTELVDGVGETPHVSSADIGMLNASMMGGGVYVFKNSDGTTPVFTLKDANTFIVPAMNMMVNGRRIIVSAAETVSITSMDINLSRVTVVCLHYTRDAGTGVETVEWVTYDGEAKPTDTPPGPTIPNEGTILDGAADVNVPIVNLKLSYGGPDTKLPGVQTPLYTVVSPVWDSLTHVASTMFNGPYALKVPLMRVGSIVIASGYAAPSNDFSSGAFQPSEKIPDGYRPARTGTILFSANNQEQSAWRIDSDGGITMSGVFHKGYMLTCSGVWFAA